jgi:hypothetical protein
MRVHVVGSYSVHMERPADALDGMSGEHRGLN